MHQRRYPRHAGFALTLAVALLTASAHNTLAVTRSYAGWASEVQKLGIKGYIKQPVVSPIFSSADLNWVGLCSDGCTSNSYVDGGSGLEWVQVGLYQGEFAGGSATTSVHIYYENMDPCGNYFADDLGAPPTNPYRVVVWNDGNGTSTYSCGGHTYTAYKFRYRLGPTSNPAISFIGKMRTIDGRADANTELHGLPTMGTNKFGCSSSTCNDTDYAIKVLQHDGVTWTHTWNGNPIGPDNPPYRNTVNFNWSFHTCPSSC